MSLRNALAVVAGLAESGAIGNYAVAGAVAALNYIQPALKVGRLKELARVRSFVEQKAVDLDRLKAVAQSSPGMASVLYKGRYCQSASNRAVNKIERHHPDNSGLYALKAKGRRQRAAALSFAEKLDAVDRLKAGIEPVVRAREERKRTRKEPNSNEQG